MHISSTQRQDQSGCNWIDNYTIGYSSNGVMFETVASVSNQTRKYVITLATFGNYTIKLSVTNNKGLSTHTLREVEVKPFDSEVKPPKGE